VTEKPWRAVRDGLDLMLRVTPKSRRDEIAGFHTAADGSVSLAIKVRALPDKGLANQAVIATLAKVLGIPKSRMSLVSGSTGRLKTVHIEGIARDLEEIIDEYFRSSRREKT